MGVLEDRRFLIFSLWSVAWFLLGVGFLHHGALFLWFVVIVRCYVCFWFTGVLYLRWLDFPSLVCFFVSSNSRMGF